MLRRVALLAGAVGVGVGARGDPCTLEDPTRRPANLRKRLVDVFVAGVEGSGHHGAVNGLLQPLLAQATGKFAARDGCVRAQEMPFFESSPASVYRKCGTISKIGWESFPSQRRVFPDERLAAVYASGECFESNAGPGAFPRKWSRLKGARAKDCFRCGSWRATAEDVYARHLASDRLDVSVLAARIPSLRVLFLWRHFAHSVFSHLPWDGGARGHAIVMAVNLAGLADDAARMDPAHFRVVLYDDLGEARYYAAVCEAAIDFLGLSADGNATAAARAKWRAPSSAHDALASADTADARAVREVEDAFRARWAIFHKPEHQLVAPDPRRRTSLATLLAPWRHAGAADEAPAAQNASAAVAAEIAACRPPALGPCRRCTPVPVTTAEKGGHGRWCIQQAGQSCCN